jgi:hypothetical protein
MAEYSRITPSPTYRRRSSRGSVPFIQTTLQLASLGTSSISSNVSLQRGLAGQVPSITFSALGPKPSPRRASVPSRLRTQGIPDTPFASSKALSDIGTGIREWYDKRLAIASQNQSGFTNQPGSKPVYGMSPGAMGGRIQNPFTPATSPPPGGSEPWLRSIMSGK